MWSLPSLKPENVDQIDGFLETDSIWAVLLFPRADRNVLRALEENWSLFSEALGPQAHVITLLEQKETKTGIKLAFPKNYGNLVGNFCKTLGIPIDEMPALVLINSAGGPANNPPYWSFAGDPENGSKMLMSIVSDMQFATFNAPKDLHGRQWREAVIRLMLSLIHI